MLYFDVDQLILRCWGSSFFARLFAGMLCDRFEETACEVGGGLRLAVPGGLARVLVGN